MPANPTSRTADTQLMHRVAPFSLESNPSQSRSHVPFRNKNGTFARQLAQTEKGRRRKEQRFSYSARKELLKKHVFDEFVNLFFLSGNSEDWIPSSSNSGPLVELYEGLMKPSFVLTKRERSNKLNFAFTTTVADIPSKYKPNNKSNRPVGVKRMTVRSANDTKGSPSKLWVYPKRRLPLKANHTKEIVPIEDWLHLVSGRGYLKLDFCNALSLCMKTVESYTFLKGKRAYMFFPEPKKASSRGKSTNSENVTNIMPPMQSISAAAPNAVISAEEELMDLTGDDPEEVELNESHIEEANAANEPLHSEISDALELAHDDDAFTIICLLFDEELKHRIEAVAAPFLEKCRSKSIKLMPIIKDALLLAKENRFGIKDQAAHKNREDALHCFKTLASTVRDALGLAPYCALRPKLL